MKSNFGFIVYRPKSSPKVFLSPSTFTPNPLVRNSQINKPYHSEGPCHGLSSRLSEVQYQDYDGINHFDGHHPRIPYPNTSIQAMSSTQYLQNGHQQPSAFNSVISDDQPLDLSLKTTSRKKNEAEWYEQEPLEACSEFPTGK